MNQSFCFMISKFYLLFTLLFSFSLSSFAQNKKYIVYSEPYKLKRALVGSGSKAYSATVLPDTVSGEKLMLISGNKFLEVYYFDRNWKLIKKFDEKLKDASAFKEDNFRVPLYVNKKGVWTLIAHRIDSKVTRETVDMNASTLTVQEEVSDKKKDYAELTFKDQGNHYAIYLNKNGETTMSVMDPGLNLKTFPFDMHTTAGKTQYNSKDVYQSFTQIDSATSMMLQYTRNKAHFHVLPEAFAVTIGAEDPLGEVIYFDKTTGRRIRSDIYTVAELLPPPARNNKFNTSVLLYGDRVYLLSAFNEGGVVAIFDRNSKKRLYEFVYDEKTDMKKFNYAPVMFDYAPVVSVGTPKAKETTEPLSMKQFCKELFKHSSGLAVRPMSDSSLLLTIGNYDPRTAFTGDGKIGASALYYISSSAGLLFREKPFVQLPDPLTYEDAKTKMSIAGMMGLLNTIEGTTFSMQWTRDKVTISSEVKNNCRYTVVVEDGELHIYAKPGVL
jgi:hypothetical protein